MIEYDKANVTSSYPSLTDYEIATILDKAYNALIAQKFTGNNPRGVAFEGDIKAMHDLQQLINTENKTTASDNNGFWNIQLGDILYLISATIGIQAPNRDIMNDERLPADFNVLSHTINPVMRQCPIKLLPHQLADEFYSNIKNIPWVKNPVGFIENDVLKVIIDPYEQPTLSATITYIKHPIPFIDNEGNVDFESNFELSNTMADELVTLAVTFALENVESPRLNTQSQMKGLES